MGTAVTNFAKVTVSTGYTASDTTIVLTAGHGSRLPSTFSYPLIWWNATDYSDPADDPNREIVTVTNRVTDTLTVTRAAEGTTGTTKNTAGKTYKMIQGITKAMWDGIFTNSLSQSFRGLSLRTHYDSDKAASRVVLTHADAIVMDDGQEVKSWDLLEADITASGGGGLDTGTEQASTWYEIYAIYNGTTKKILLHRAKDYFLDEDVTAGEDGQHLLRDATARTKLSQGFQVDTAGLLEFIDVKLVKVGSPTGNFWFTVEANSGGVPSNTPLATSDKYDVSRLTTTAGWVRIPFRAPVSLSAVTQYHLVLQGDFTVSGTNHMGWRADTTAATYARGSKAAYDGTTWTSDTDDDFVFKAYITRNDTAVTLPSGYTQKALIGFVYNDSGSNLKSMQARDRRVMLLTTAAPASSSAHYVGSFSVVTLFDLSAYVPPREVVVGFGIDGSAATVEICVADGTVPVFSSGDPISTARNAYTTGGANGGDRPSSQLRGVVIASQSVKALIGASTGHLWVEEFDW